MAEYFGTNAEAVFATMPERFIPEKVQDVDVTIGYDITGEGGGIWLVAIQAGTLKAEKIDSELPECSASIKTDAETFVGGSLGRIDLNAAMFAGKFKVKGDISVMTNILPKAFKKFSLAGEEQAEEFISIKAMPSINQRFATGAHMGQWFKGLMNKKFYAAKCPSCGRIQIPPREVCAECVVRSDDFVEVGPNGTVANMDIVYYASPDPLTGKVRSTPYVTLYLWMDGTTPGECLSFDLNPKDTNRIQRGMRVRPVWNEVRNAGIDDLLYFEIDDLGGVTMGLSRVDSADCFVMPGKMVLPVQYFAGRVGSKFIISLRDDKKILGVKCPKCDKVYGPPREFCEKDLAKLDENWVELGNEGIITNYTIVNYNDRHLPLKAPYILALIKVDGADTPFAHIVSGIDPDQVTIGMRVKAVFAEKTTNTILDIAHFVPVID